MKAYTDIEKAESKIKNEISHAVKINIQNEMIAAGQEVEDFISTPDNSMYTAEYIHGLEKALEIISQLDTYTADEIN